MLLKSIKLQNFRQFCHETLTFAREIDGKNVTIILGDNGSGKTSFAQAFFWCLYGHTSFSDPVVLNKIVAEKMMPETEEYVKVVLELHHGDVDYTLTRTQTYRKDSANAIKSKNVIFEIQQKGPDGRTVFIKPNLLEGTVRNILPEPLSRYFFFDGERIEKMSKDISSGKKADDFAEAVKGLLGLDAILSAINHLSPRSKYNVIGSYEAQFNQSANKDIAALSKTIDGCTEKLSQIDARLEEIDNDVMAAQSRKDAKTEALKQFAEGEKLQGQREELHRQIADAETTRAIAFADICKYFSKSLQSTLSLGLIKDAMTLLAEKNFTGKDIPHMHQDTIKYLLKQGQCICGTHLDEGSLAYNKLKELMNFLPPQSLSSMFSTFKREARRHCDEFSRDDVFQQVNDKLSIISKLDENISDWQNEIQVIDKTLSGNDVHAQVKSLNDEIRFCNEIIAKNGKERDKAMQAKGAAESQRQQAVESRSRLTLLDKNNQQIQQNITYARRIYDDLLATYQQQEESVRNRLQNTINDIFKKIYEGGLYLTIDEKYHISVSATDYKGEVETSTAQSIAVIFAFITGIIQLAKENKNKTGSDSPLLSSEPYPLVMDAPLSAFDKRRIKTVCEALPATAEQVIIFIKDTDGELANDYMGSRIGSRHKFIKKNEFETILK